MRWCTAIAICVAVGGVATGAPLDKVQVGDLPGTNARWQVGEVTVAAPASEVWRWFTDVRGWPARFPDDTWARETGRTADGRKLVDFHSRALGRTLHLEIREQRGLITYTGAGKDVTTQGKIYIEALGPNTTRVLMQTTGELHGVAGVFAPESTKRKRAIRKLTADLNATVRLANAWAAAQRRGG